MLFKIRFEQTPYNTIRVWMEFDEAKRDQVINTSEFIFFQFASNWGGYDKCEKGMVSWELPMSLREFIIEKFKYRVNCEFRFVESA